MIPHMLRMPEHEKIITERLDDTATHTNYCKKKKRKKEKERSSNQKRVAARVVRHRCSVRAVRPNENLPVT